MSTAWYFFTFRLDRLARVFGHATDAEVRKLVAAMIDPDEYFDVKPDQLAARAAAATAALQLGVSYDGSAPPSAALLDDVVTMTFHRSGLAGAIGAKPVSHDAVNIRLADPVAELAAARRPDSLLSLLRGGRRLGQTAPCMHCRYLDLTPPEVRRMRDETAEMSADPAVAWPSPGRRRTPPGFSTRRSARRSTPS